MTRSQQYMSYLMIMVYDPGRKTLTVAPASNALGPDLQISRLTLHERMPPYMVSRPTFDNSSWLFIHFHSEAAIIIDDNSHILPPNTMVCWPPGSAHDLGHPHISWDHSWCFCQGMTINRLMDETGITTCSVFKLNNGALSEAFFNDCHAELLRPQPDAVIVAALLCIWIRSCQRQAGQGDQESQREQRLLRVRQHIEGHLAEDLHLSDLATIAEMSASHFSAAFRDCFGCSPGAFMVERRLQQAAMLLQRDRAAIKDIAQACGFNDPFHFSRIFKRRYGSSPRTYRQRVC